MDGFLPIERNSGVAAWRQIADRISQQIGAGAFDRTGMIPPEMVLAEKFGVNRHTVRNAIAALADEGLLKRVQGRGTMVEKRERLVFPISSRTRFSDGIGSQASEHSLHVLESDRVAADDEVAAALHLEVGAECIRLQTLGTADGRPVSNAVSFFDAFRFPGMADLVRGHQSVTKAFAAQGVGDYLRVSTEVVARKASAEEAARLQLSPGDIVLVTTSINADLDRQPIQYSRTAFAADRIALRLDTPGA